MNADIILDNISSAIDALQNSPSQEGEEKIKSLINKSLKNELFKMNMSITQLLAISNYLNSLYSLTNNTSYYDLMVLIIKLIRAYRHLETYRD